MTSFKIVTRTYWFNEELVISDVAVAPVVCVVLKLPVSATAHGHFVLPSIHIKGVPLFLEDQPVARRN